jgi:hypothetical protein
MSIKADQYSRDYQNVADSNEDKDTCIPRFYMEAEEFEVDGSPQWRDREMVEVIIPGNANTRFVKYVDEHVKARWPNAYRAFKENQSAPVIGTPLEQWARLSPAMVMKLKSTGFRTVEDIARVADYNLGSLGLGGMKLRLLAQAFINDADRMAVTNKAVEDAMRFEARCKELESQVEASNSQFRQMFEEIKALKMNQSVALQNLGSAPAMQGQPVYQPSIQPQAPSSPFASLMSPEEQAAELSQFNQAVSRQPLPVHQPAQATHEMSVPANKPRRGPKTKAEKAAIAAAQQGA